MGRKSSTRIPTQIQQNVIDASLQAMLGKLVKKNPAVAREVSRKWAEDEQKFMTAVREKTEGKSQESWAKTSCKHCYGRGYVGILVSNKSKVICRCAIKNYQKWLQEFREEFNAARGKEDASNDEPSNSETPPQAADRSEDSQEALTTNTT